MSMIVPNVEDLVSAGHEYRKFLKVINFKQLCKPLERKYSHLGRGGYPVSTGFKSLVLQFLLDLSDRQMEEHLRDSLSAKYFCNFGLYDQTPDHSYFGALRERIGTEELVRLFNIVTKSLKQAGLIREVFTFVDASKLISKIDTWKARDKAIADSDNEEKDDDGKPKMNNKNVGDYSSDPDARFGCKGKDDFWLGYKRHVSVDMSNGLINQTDVTSADVPDQRGLKLVCPNGGMVFADKAYCVEASQKALREKGCHSGAILKNNMKGKNRDKDSWLTKVRMPYEGVFSKMSKAVRYRTIIKVKFQGLMQAFVYNLRRLVRIHAEPIPLVDLYAA